VTPSGPRVVSSASQLVSIEDPSAGWSTHAGSNPEVMPGVVVVGPAVMGGRTVSGTVVGTSVVDGSVVSGAGTVVGALVDGASVVAVTVVGGADEVVADAVVDVDAASEPHAASVVVATIATIATARVDLCPNMAATLPDPTR